MESTQQSPVVQAYHAPSSADTVDYRIRCDPNPLQEDPDVDEDVFYRITPGNQVNIAQLDTCARDFSAYYGVWSDTAQHAMGSWAKPGQHIHLSSERLRAQSLPEGANNILVTVLTEEGRQGGHCFVSQWMHGDDRVWWITQLLVLPRYRNQMRATRMLQTLTKHFNIGKKPSCNDYVGVASSHPYTLCAVLRVFGHGIESLPSKPDWESNPSEYPHAPLPSPRCEPIVKSAPVNYIRDATVASTALVVNTHFFVDHQVPAQALERIVHGINRQVREPWQWLFGELPEGHEYLCILKFRDDPEYKPERRLRGSEFVLNEKEQGEKIVGETSKSTLFGQSKSTSPVPYAEIDRYLLRSYQTNTKASQHVSQSVSRSIKRRVVEGKELLARETSMLRATMGAKEIPTDLREAYKEKESPLPDHISTWTDFWTYSHAVAASGEYDHVSLAVAERINERLLILQAIHFQELLNDLEKMRKDADRKRIELDKKKNKEERKGLRARSEERKPFTVLTTNATTQENAKSLVGPSETSSTSVAASKPQVRRLLNPIIPVRPKRTIPLSLSKRASPAIEHTSTINAGRKPQTASRLAALRPGKHNEIAKPYETLTPPTSPRAIGTIDKQSAAAPVNANRLLGSQRAVDFNPKIPNRKSQVIPTPPQLAITTAITSPRRTSAILPPTLTPQHRILISRPSYMSPTRSSIQRYAASSPQLFFSDGSSDGSSRSTPIRTFPKNAGNVLQRGRKN